jgi:hypothetical protein
MQIELLMGSLSGYPSQEGTLTLPAQWAEGQRGEGRSASSRSTNPRIALMPGVLSGA